jgi:hypothetical protein
MKQSSSFYVILSILSMSFLACESNKKTEKADVTVCKFSDVGKTQTIPLSSLVENCVLIRFEDIDEALFKPWFTTVTDKYIGIRQQDMGEFKLFDHSGKFLGNIGSVGQGPGEYAGTLYDEIIDDKNDLIYLAAMVCRKIPVYRANGEYVKSIELPQDMHKPKMHLSDDGSLTIVHMAFTGEKAIVIRLDADGKVVRKLAPPAHLLSNNYDGEIFNASNTSAFEFLHTGSDTLYHYDIQKNQIQPVFTISVNSSEKPFRQYVELPNHYITNVFDKGLVATDKQTNHSSFVKIVNDYYGNISMPGYVINFRNGWYVHNLEPAQLIEQIENRLQESSCTESDREQLQSLLSTLDENSNNLLFLGKLKK